MSDKNPLCCRLACVGVKGGEPSQLLPCCYNPPPFVRGWTWQALRFCKGLGLSLRPPRFLLLSYCVGCHVGIYAEQT